MIRRQFQLDASAFRIAPHPKGFVVVETWHEINRRGDKDQEDETWGPFPTKGAAQAEIDRQEAL